MDNPPIEKRYELEQLKNALIEKVDVLKGLDNAVSKLLEDSAEVDENAFGQELSDASDHIMTYRRVVDLVDVELKKAIPSGAGALTIDDVASTNEAGGSNVDSEPLSVEQTVVPQTPTFTTQLTSSSAASSVRVRLPKLEVKNFKESVFEWQEFWDAFESSIHTNAGLSDVDKFSYLKGLVDEPAKSAISGFSLTAANYGSAVELLMRRFGKPSTIQRAHINELLSVQAVYRERETARLRALYDKIECHYRGLIALKVDEATYLSIVVPTLLEKLPESVRLTMTRGKNFKEWTMDDLLKHLLVEVELREEAVISTPNDGRNQTETNERKNLLRKYAKSFNCLDKGHMARNCMQKVFCRNCKGQHHTALYEGKNSKKVEEGDKEGESQHEGPVDPVNTNNTFVATSCRIALQTAQAVVKGDKQLRVRVLFDLGSHKSYVTAKTANAAGLKVVRKELLGLSTFGQKAKETEVRDVVCLDVMPLRCGKVLTLEAYVVPGISHVRNEHIEVVKHNFPHLKDLWFSDVNKTAHELEIDLLIGSDNLWNFQSGRIVRGELDEPVALETELGFVLSGPLKEKRADDENAGTHVNMVVGEPLVLVNVGMANVEEAVHRLWDLDSLGIKESDEVRDGFGDSIGFDGQRYSVKLPWKVGNTTLPTNYELSLSRMKAQVKRLRKQPEILAEYDSKIKQQLEVGVIERVPELDTAEKVHYLPHQAVVRQDAKTTKVRVVYDASATDSKSKMSLNDCLHVGPSLNPLLIDLLLRFRVNRVALVADIEKAFLNVSVDKADRDCLRFLWPDDPNDNKSDVSIYCFCRVVFGLNASPFLHVFMIP